MVITGIFMYMKRNGLYKKVSINDLAENLRKEENETIKLLIDFSGFKYLPYICDNCQYGWEWNLVIERLKKFVGNLREIKVEPIFYFRFAFGCFDKEKWKYWVTNDNKKIKDIFHSLKEYGYSSKNCFPHGEVYFLFILKYECDVEIYKLTDDGYSELAEHARKQEDCLGILSVHPDYLIFDTKLLLSLAKLDFSSLSTEMYIHSQLVRKINLTGSQLMLLSCLAGNSVINYTKLLSFHQKIGYEHGKTKNILSIDLIANYIKKNNWMGNIDELPQIAKITGIDEELLRKAFTSYSKLAETDTSDNEKYVDFSNELNLLKEKRIHSEVPPAIYGILKNQTYFEGSNFQDICDSSIPPFALIYREMRQKMYRVLFNNKNVMIEEWCFHNGSNLDQPDMVGIHEEEFSGEIPSLVELLSENENMEEIRWKLFSYCVGIEVSVLRNVDPSLLSLYCILNYLLIFGVELKEWELKVFICQAVHPKGNDAQYLENLEVNYSPRIVQLDDLYQKGIYNLMHVLTVCGFPFRLENVMPWKVFNRKLFVYLYNQMEENPRIEETLDRNVDAITSFSKVYKILVNSMK